MSLPSIKNIDPTMLTVERYKAILFDAIQQDLPLAFAWFKSLKPGIHYSENPNSELAKQIKRVVADGMRTVLEENLFSGKKIIFANCCDVIVDPPIGFCPVLFQFQTQNGALNHADC